MKTTYTYALMLFGSSAVLFVTSFPRASAAGSIGIASVCGLAIVTGILMVTKHRLAPLVWFVCLSALAALALSNMIRSGFTGWRFFMLVIIAISAPIGAYYIRQDLEVAARRSSRSSVATDPSVAPPD